MGPSAVSVYRGVGGNSICSIGNSAIHGLGETTGDNSTGNSVSRGLRGITGGDGEDGSTLGRSCCIVKGTNGGTPTTMASINIPQSNIFYNQRNIESGGQRNRSRMSKREHKRKLS